MPATDGATFEPLPDSAAWRHEGARAGFESTFFRPDPSGYRIEGHAAAVAEGHAWAVHYVVRVDAEWRTRFATLLGWSQAGSRRLVLESDGDGRWSVDQAPDASLDGCLDVDLEASAFTNAIPVRRLRLQVGEQADAPAAYVRAHDLRVERREQRYARVAGQASNHEFDHTAPASAIVRHLVYDASGLVVDYPGLASRSL